MQQTAEAMLAQEKIGLRPQGSWTYEDWLNFPDDGWKYEIIDGELQMTPPPGTGHQLSSGSLFARLYLYVEDHNLGKVLEAPCAVRLPTQPVPLEPDIFFIRKENLHIITKKEVRGVPDLIVEILSPSNASYDRETKFAVYQQAGVPEYWLVDYQAKTVECFVLQDGVYAPAGTYRVGDTVSAAVVSGFTIAVATLFDF